MNEAFISYLWQYGLYSCDAALHNGCKFKVESPGLLNRDSGPDFTGARIRIDGTLWAGNVEVHVRSSDWYLHRHDDDPAYSTVILHVVYQHDYEVVMPDKTNLPVFELQNHIDSQLYTRYLQFLASSNDIPCSALINYHKLPVPSHWLISLGVQRLIRKGEELSYLFDRLKYDWNEVFYVSFCRSFGNKLNDDLFEMLALKIPYKLAVKYSVNRTDLEALFFGQSGLLKPFLNADNDLYTRQLIQNYQQMQYQYDLEPMEPYLWRFLRTRPANFPTIRIAQLVALLGSFININPLSVNELENWYTKAIDSKVTDYWQKHIHFNRKGSGLPLNIGVESVRKLVINGFLPPLLRYGKAYKHHNIISSFIDLVASMPSETNRITRRWKKIGIESKSALESQGITELYNEYCRNKQCLECRFGHHLLAKEVAQPDT